MQQSRSLAPYGGKRNRRGIFGSTLGIAPGEGEWHVRGYSNPGTALKPASSFHLTNRESHRATGFFQIQLLWPATLVSGFPLKQSLCCSNACEFFKRP